MPTKREDLIDEIIANARRDRKRLESVADGLIQKYNDTSDFAATEESQAQADPEVAAAFSEELAKVSDSLTKINQQLVEIVKVEKKSSSAQADGKLSSEDVEDAYNEIQPEDVTN